MTEPKRIKNIEEQIDLVGLLLGVDLSRLPPEEAMKLKRSALDLYRLGHASGFKAGADHATNAIAAVVEPRRKLGFAGRLRRDWQGVKTSLRSIGATFTRQFSAHIFLDLGGQSHARLPEQGEGLFRNMSAVAEELPEKSSREARSRLTVIYIPRRGHHG